jgi:hypothetical protein
MSWSAETVSHCPPALVYVLPMFVVIHHDAAGSSPRKQKQRRGMLMYVLLVFSDKSLRYVTAGDRLSGMYFVVLHDSIVVHVEFTGCVYVDDSEPPRPLIDWHIWRVRVAQVPLTPANNSIAE